MTCSSSIRTHCGAGGLPADCWVCNPTMVTTNSHAPRIIPPPVAYCARETQKSLPFRLIHSQPVFLSTRAWFKDCRFWHGPTQFALS
jgi:hypothetical protein